MINEQASNIEFAALSFNHDGYRNLKEIADSPLLDMPNHLIDACNNLMSS